MAEEISTPLTAKLESTMPPVSREFSSGGGSRFFDISLRGWIALIVVLCFVMMMARVCYLATDLKALQDAVKEVFLPTLGNVIIFYFATKPAPPPPPPPALPPIGGEAK